MVMKQLFGIAANGKHIMSLFRYKQIKKIKLRNITTTNLNNTANNLQPQTIQVL